MNPTNLDDASEESALLAQVASDNEKAFSQLISRYSLIVYRYLLYWLKEPQLIEELAQDIFVRVWRNRQKLPQIDNFKGYLYVMTRNKVRTALKQQLLKANFVHTDLLEEVMIRPHHQLELQELSNLLTKAVNALPPRRKEIFLLSREEGLTYEAIANRLHISKGTVKDHMVAALLFLRQYLSEQAGIVLSLFSCCFILSFADFF